MSETRDRFSLGEFSEIFSNDNSDGHHRLAEFLQKKKGVGTRRRRAFADYEPSPFKLKVQIEKQTNPSAAPPQHEEGNADADADADENHPLISDHPNCPQNKSTNSRRRSGRLSVGSGRNAEQGRAGPTPERAKQQEHVSSQERGHLPEAPSKQHGGDAPCKVADARSPTAHYGDDEGSPRKAISPGANSPIKSPSARASILRSGGRSHADKLRRYSLKRLSYGRRTLLTDFENTLTTSEFLPPVCSTPCTHSTTKNSTPEVEVNAAESALPDQQATDTSKETNFDTMQSLKRKDDELKDMLQNVLDATNKICNERSHSPCRLEVSRRRSYKMEKGAEKGQIVLTPAKSPAPLSQDEVEEHYSLDSSPIRTQLHVSERRQLLTGNMIIASPKDDVHCTLKSVNRSSNTSGRRSGALNITIVPNTPPGRLDAAPTQPNICIPETQELLANAEELINSTPSKQMRMVVCVSVPHQNVIHEVNVKSEHVTSPEACVPAATAVQAAETLQPTEELPAEEDLRLADILTDDEDETPRHHCNSSSVPLNLVSSNTRTTRTRRLWKRSTSRRQLRMEESPVLSTETETEMGPPRAHPMIINRVHSTRGRPTRRVLNKAPRTPINGELFAPELARLSNYEILDLRKRNSLGRVFPISGRKSHNAKREANEKRIQLDEKIQIEIRKRNLCVGDDADIKKSPELTPTPNLPTPTNLPDTDVNYTTSPEVVLQHLRESMYKLSTPLIGERDTDIVSFRNSTNDQSRSVADKRNTRRSHQQTIMPEVMQNYLEVPKKIKNLKKIHQELPTKRSLYTKGFSDSEANRTVSCSPAAAQIRRRKSISPQGAASPPSSPPVPDAADSPVRATVEPIPPPELFSDREQPADETSVTGETAEVGSEKEVSVSKASNEHVFKQPKRKPIPPPELFSDREQPADETAVTCETAEAGSEKEVSVSKASDEHVFKKPKSRAPRKKLQEALITAHEPGQTLANESDSTTLRRSKRGHVPLKNTWSFRTNDPTPLFQLKYQEQLLKTMKAKQKRLDKSGSSTTASRIDVSLPIASSTVNAVKPGKPRKRAQAQQQKQKETQAAYSLLGDISCSTASVASARQLNHLSTITEPDSESEAAQGTTMDELAVPNSTTTKGKSRNNTAKATAKNRGLERSRLNITSTPVDHINNLFDQLKSGNADSVTVATVELPSQTQASLAEPPPTPSSTASSSTACKKLRVRLKRTPLPNAQPQKKAPKSNASLQSDVELLTWLKGMQDIQSTNASDKIFKEMHCSAADNLVFIDLEGVDYAFYDTDEKGSMGYMRFKPNQLKPPKRTNKYSLHYVVLSGVFKFRTNGEYGMFSPGDMVVINTGSLYSIHNKSDDIGILMVVKK